MRFEDLKLVRQWHSYAGPKDERLEAESCRIYRTGFVLLTFGMLVILVYKMMAAQVSWVHDTQPDGTMYTSSTEVVVLVWLIVCCAIGGVMQARRGFVETNRFAQTDSFPAGYFLLVSALTGGAMALVIWAIRCVAELQVVPADQVFWLANLAVGLVFGTIAFLVSLPIYYLQFRAAKGYRKKVGRELGEE